MHRYPIGVAVQQPLDGVAVRRSIGMQRFRRRQFQIDMGSVKAAGAGHGRNNQPTDHILLAGPVAAPLFQRQRSYGCPGIIPHGDIGAVVAALGAVGGDGSGASDADDGQRAFPQRHSPLPGGARHPAGGVGGNRLLRGVAAEEIGHRPVAVGDAGFQHGARRPAHAQQPGQGIVAGAGHGNHGLRRRSVNLRDQFGNLDIHIRHHRADCTTMRRGFDAETQRRRDFKRF